LGYYARQSIAQKQAGTLEAKLQKKVLKAKQDSDVILAEARQKAQTFLESAKRAVESRREEVYKTDQLLLRRENILDQKLSNFERTQKEFEAKVERLRAIKESLESLRQEAITNLEKISKLSQEEAKKELLQNLEKEYQQEILEKLRGLEKEGWEKYENRAKELLATAIQKFGLSQAQEITTTSLNLPSEDIKGKIIGKEGRNIRTLEKLTGVEIIVDETPESVVISGFDPVRRQIAKVALEKLIQDGRIQPARIEEQVQIAEKEIV